ncbi:acetobutylicum phosphotransbutyrylase [Clostridium botulinum]|uniref:VanZ family protein n=1 Tax=Clostridium botulinum TaxID=1491 RepID=UPI0013F940FF|nr:VanZ family protein [Clostridium botulinum]MBY6917970.1 VanZ family protein [Clostridium botulinum]NFO31250.1 acetobutylicum phosphotransbutyrylase [Clostridium botulinum]NFO40982.1 acetobutylicum phosphotransbutyrylase [Clostridium botulinum]NFO54509.1 acetobutylicum phosphotransbutyrylase [Clostridium botulinum]NFQ39724.1 acetobutylicum phosphotransbutyrylase [Clostridium botulinum]
MKKIFYIILSLMCLGFIFFNSSQDGTESNIRSNTVIEKIATDINEDNINIQSILKTHINRKQFNLLIRKCAHGFEFAILSILLFMSLNFFGLSKRNLIIYTLFIVLFSAVMDEFFQLFVPGRNSSVKDIVIDLIGGGVGVLIVTIINRIKCKCTG